MVTFKHYFQYLILFNLSTVSSFNYFYLDKNIFEQNFSELGLSELQLLLVINLFTSLIYVVLEYVFQIRELITKYNLIFCSTVLTAVSLMWVIKFINLSRLFLATTFLIFLFLTILFTRFIERNADEIFISFDKELSTINENIEFTDYKSFPSDFLDTISKLLTNKSLKGLIYNREKYDNVSFDQIIEMSNFLGVNIYEFQNNKYRIIHKSTSLNNFIKNIEDVILLGFLFPIFSFLCLTISLLVLIFDGFPIIYTQNRVGLNGRYFKIYKFRTMRNISIPPKDLKKLNEKNKIVFKSKNDPRITKFGSFLRKSSMDELPQILNVLKNDMSFVGPRPPVVEEVRQYELKHLKRISVKPGITGLWQVTLRQNNDFDTWVQKDIEYIENWSLFLDIKILFKTISEVLKLTGD